MELMQSRFAVSLAILMLLFTQTLLSQQVKMGETQLPQDLVFSDEIFLPGYEKGELGRLEHPSIALDKKSNLYIAYNYTGTDGREAIYLTSFDVRTVRSETVTNPKTPAWKTPLQVSTADGTEYMPDVAVTSDDVLWIVWSARRNKSWEIYARTYSNGELGKELQVTSNDEYDFRPRVLSDHSERIWIAWERGTKEKNIIIVAKYFEKERWSDEIILENRPGYAYRPMLLEAPDKSIWFAWDITQGANADVYIRKFNNGTLGMTIRVTSHPAMDNKCALTWHDGKLWVSWTTNRRGEDDWGIIRYTMVRAFDGKAWYEPAQSMPGIDLASQAETQSYEFPTMTFDRFGRLYLFNRHDHVFSAATYEGGEWSHYWNLDEPAWGIRGFSVQTVWASDTELWMARRDRKTITIQKMVRVNPQIKEIRLNKHVQRTYPAEVNSIEREGDHGPTQQGGFRVYYGDVHVHTAYSDGSGSFDDVFNLYRNIYRRDFVAITDHDALRAGDNHFSPGEWAYLKALNEIYNQPGEFVTINGYEWTHSTWSGKQDSASRVGHKNVYFKGGEESPLFSHKSPEAFDPTTLFKTLHNADAIAFPHHPAWGGMTWADHDPEIQTNYEIVSIHGANEYAGNLPIPHRGGMPGVFAQDGLAKGAKIGFVGGTDSHGLYYHAHEGWREDPYKGGMTAVLVQGPLTREVVWEALKARRNYATSGEKHYIEFSVNGFPMGSAIQISNPPVVSFEARSDRILYAYVVRNNNDRFISGPVDGRMARYVGVDDRTIEPGRNYYYLRVVYKDGNVAWSSPIWVEYTPH